MGQTNVQDPARPVPIDAPAACKSENFTQTPKVRWPAPSATALSVAGATINKTARIVQSVPLLSVECSSQLSTILSHPRFRSGYRPGFLKGLPGWVLLGLLVGWLGCDRSNPPGNSATPQPSPPSQSVADASVDFVSQARQAIARNDFAAAEKALQNQLVKDPSDTVALELAGDLAVQRGDAASAVQMYQAAAGHLSPPALPLLDKLTQTLVMAGKPFDAITVLHETIGHFPNHPQPRYDLAGLATMVGRPSESLESLRWLAQRQQSDAESLLVLANPGRVEPDLEMCRKLSELAGKDLRPDFGLARWEASQLNWDAVANRLEPMVARHKDFLPGSLLYGRALIELDEGDKLMAWQSQVPGGAEEDAEYWIVAGLWSQNQSRHPEAARALWESLRLDAASHPEVMTSLMRSLNEIGRAEEAEIVADLIHKHGIMRDALLTHLERDGRSQQAAMKVAEAMEELGRLWEAEAWARLAITLPDDPLADVRKRHLAIHSQLTVKTPWQLPERMVGSRIDLSDLPLVQWSAARSDKPIAADLAAGEIRFEDQAAQRGWVHTCAIAPEAVQQGHWIFQSVGGGVGVIDFDLDGWPDFAAAMLDGKPLQSNSSPNRLFRNLDGKFVDVTAATGYRDTGFGQGITVADYNDDGFPDIFDANIGRNRLYRNNGDGTFQEVDAGLESDDWTASAVIADIDGDSIADLYEANYCSGREPYEQPCRNNKGISTCPPLQFDAQTDRVWKGRSDGTFQEMTKDWMEQTSPGRGLGAVVGMLDERPGLDLYIANDMTANHLWSADLQEPPFRLTDLGAIRGLGFNSQSSSQASMGMAAGDPDQDGDIDFFLTHFTKDHNTFYEQVGPGLWADRSHQFGLALPSMMMLGFGTEWADFDNNGTLELIVANGHVDDVDRAEIQYRMPPQLFQVDRRGRYAELDRKSLGKYFEGEHLGRALVSVDVNRDGKTDVAITHLYDPVALLVNQTRSSGQSIGLELKSVHSQRDAIGAKVSMIIAGKKVFAQLTAGDGYMCSNQRRITVGTGGIDQAQEVHVTWPSGKTSNFGTLASGRDYLLVEGEEEAFLLHNHED